MYITTSERSLHLPWFVLIFVVIFLCWVAVDLRCCTGFSLVVVHGLLIAVTFLVAELGLFPGSRAQAQ